MSEQDNIEVIRRGYEAFSAGDVQAVMDSFADDVEWIQPGESAISGTYHGKTEVMEYLGRLAEKSVSVTVNRLLADGDLVVALTTVTMGDESGDDADVFTLRDGKTVRVQIHGDTALMERVYGKKELATG
jgi:uncharacterized protein